jgi:hypothetical protein
MALPKILISLLGFIIIILVCLGIYRVVSSSSMNMEKASQSAGGGWISNGSYLGYYMT